MAQLIVRNLKPEIVSALRTRAARKGRSMEAEHREILSVALRPGRGRASFKEWLVVTYLLDTNILSELRKGPRCNPRVASVVRRDRR